MTRAGRGTPLPCVQHPRWISDENTLSNYTVTEDMVQGTLPQNGPQVYKFRLVTENSGMHQFHEASFLQNFWHFASYSTFSVFMSFICLNSWEIVRQNVSLKSCHIHHHFPSAWLSSNYWGSTSRQKLSRHQHLATVCKLTGDLLWSLIRQDLYSHRRLSCSFQSQDSS